ncbi:Methyltransferase domain protein [Leptospira santarosai]|nr:Methyltransferase domain protein [Leptospira santarosai]
MECSYFCGYLLLERVRALPEARMCTKSLTEWKKINFSTTLIWNERFGVSFEKNSDVQVYKDYFLPKRKKVLIGPLPLTSMTPLSSNANISLRDS